MCRYLCVGVRGGLCLFVWSLSGCVHVPALFRGAGECRDQAEDQLLEIRFYQPFTGDEDAEGALQQLKQVTRKKKERKKESSLLPTIVMDN